MKVSEFRKLIREEVRKVLNEQTFYEKLKSMNPGWSKEKALADFADEYDKDEPGDYEEHQQYLKDAEATFDKLAKKSPSVKVGDLVKVYVRSKRMHCIGKITKEATMSGSYGLAGDIMPDKIPAWEIKCYTDKPGYEKQKDQMVVKGKTYYYIGTLGYPQHDEGHEDTFTKL